MLDPLWPYAPIYDLHEMAGGLQLPAFAAPNVRRTVKAGAGGLHSGRETGIPYT